jgi:hypothetical protein
MRKVLVMRWDEERERKKINQAQHKRCSRCSGKGRSRNKIKKERNKSSATQTT